MSIEFGTPLSIELLVPIRLLLLLFFKPPVKPVIHLMKKQLNMGSATTASAAVELTMMILQISGVPDNFFLFLRYFWRSVGPFGKKSEFLAAYQTQIEVQNWKRSDSGPGSDRSDPRGCTGQAIKSNARAWIFTYSQ